MQSVKKDKNLEGIAKKCTTVQLDNASYMIREDQKDIISVIRTNS